VRFLADESCDFAAVRALRAAGHDVLAVSEFQQRSVDEELMALALGEERILITEDKDFGTLTFASQHESHGVILLRFPASARGRSDLRRNAWSLNMASVPVAHSRFCNPEWYAFRSCKATSDQRSDQPPSKIERFAKPTPTNNPAE